MSKRRPIPLKLRFQILKRDHFKCKYCGRSAKEVPLHIDHKKSVKDGGTNDPDNLVTACVECNLGKGSRSYDLDELDSQEEVNQLYRERMNELDAGYNDCRELAKKTLEVREFLQRAANRTGWFEWEYLIPRYDIVTIYEAIAFVNSVTYYMDNTTWWKKVCRLCSEIYNIKMKVL